MSDHYRDPYDPYGQQPHPDPYAPHEPQQQPPQQQAQQQPYGTQAGAYDYGYAPQHQQQWPSAGGRQDWAPAADEPTQTWETQTWDAQAWQQQQLPVAEPS
ncbi:hypothetical protein GCM10020221_20260 [Streptomyces thioluteus]|uniref:Uncharacterized protein n=1 Tax=Streptomyces thioluteus TaxID=66431 RepID=A0ABP6J902_STRTU